MGEKLPRPMGEVPQTYRAWVLPRAAYIRLAIGSYSPVHKVPSLHLADSSWSGNLSNCTSASFENVLAMNHTSEHVGHDGDGRDSRTPGTRC